MRAQKLRGSLAVPGGRPKLTSTGHCGIEEGAWASAFGKANRMKPHQSVASVPLFEALEGRQCLSATTAGTDVLATAADAAPSAANSSARHHKHHLHTLHHQHALHQQRRQKSHKHHLHTLHAAHVQRREAHHTHHVHFLHTQHRAHVLRTTVPAPLVLTAQQRNDWPAIRDQVLANRGRVKI